MGQTEIEVLGKQGWKTRSTLQVTRCCTFAHGQALKSPFRLNGCPCVQVENGQSAISDYCNKIHYEILRKTGA